MKLAHIPHYGPPEVIAVIDGPPPRPRVGEVVVRVRAAAVTAGDARIRGGRFPRGFGTVAKLAIGLRGPRSKRAGMVFSGDIVEVGGGVSGFAVGDEVAGMTGARLGAHAELVAVASSAIAFRPASVSHVDAAAALFGGSTAAYFLRDRVQVMPRQRVLVNGAAGSVGSMAVQIAARAGAEVTAVASEANHALLRRLGAGAVIDYRATPVDSIAQRFDVVFDAYGNITRKQGLRMLNAGGSLVLAVAGLGDMLRARGPVVVGTSPEKPEVFAALLAEVARGELDPLAEEIGGLESLVQAHRRIDAGHKVGNLVIVP